MAGAHAFLRLRTRQNPDLQNRSVVLFPSGKEHWSHRSLARHSGVERSSNWMLILSARVIGVVWFGFFRLKGALKNVFSSGHIS